MAKLASGYHEHAITAEGKAKEQQQTITDMQVRQRDVAALDAKYTGELVMPKLSLMLFSSALVLASAGCASTQPAQKVIPPPPAWMMQSAPDLLTPLNGIISSSDSESKPAER